MLRPGIVGIRGSMVIRLWPCMISSPPPPPASYFMPPTHSLCSFLEYIYIYIYFVRKFKDRFAWDTKRSSILWTEWWLPILPVYTFPPLLLPAVLERTHTHAMRRSLSRLSLTGTLRLPRNTLCLTPLAPHSHMWGQSTLITRSLPPKRDCGPKRVKYTSLAKAVTTRGSTSYAQTRKRKQKKKSKADRGTRH